MRRGVAAGALGGALVLMTAACGGSAGGGSADVRPAAAKGTATAAPKPTVSAAVLSIEPKNGSQDVKPAGPVKVSVASGKLTTVRVTDKDGKEVPGSVAADGVSWVPKGGLSVGTQYRVSAQAADANGVVATAESSFTTLTPDEDAGPHDNISDGQTYGVGMIVSLTFERTVKDKAAVEKGITFETSDGSVVKGHWFGGTRVDFRPEKFWTPGTKVTIHYRLKSVEVAPDVYGGVDADEPFVIGRSQISTVDVAEHEMQVVKDGQVVDNIPITAGKPGFDSWNGTMVIKEMAERTRMSSQGVSGIAKGDEYDLDDVPHAMRLTDSGTYVHGNSWATGAMGSYNASHGCIGVADARNGSNGSDAGKLYNSSLIGDVVTVVNSKGPKVEAWNGLSGWNVNWGEW